MTLCWSLLLNLLLVSWSFVALLYTFQLLNQWKCLPSRFILPSSFDQGQGWESGGQRRMTSTDWDHEDNAICLALCIPTGCYHKVRLASDRGQSTFITLTGSHSKSFQVFQALWQFPLTSSELLTLLQSLLGDGYPRWNFLFFIFRKNPEPLTTLVTAALLKAFLYQSVFWLPEENWHR